MPQQIYPAKGHIYDLIIVGAGFTGTECALKAATAGLDVLLVTTSLDTVYNLMGDGAKLEPYPNTFMAQACQDLAQEDAYVGTWALHRAAKYALEHTNGIHFLQSNISSLLVDEEGVRGIDTWEGVERLAKKTALCVGSFLEARLSIGSLVENAGRLSEMTYDDLYNNLNELGFMFDTLELETKFDDESLPYKVRFKTFAASEKAKEGFALKKLPNLYAAGLCVDGSLSYEGAALQGQSLAEQIILDLG